MNINVTSRCLNKDPSKEKGIKRNFDIVDFPGGETQVMNWETPEQLHNSHLIHHITWQINPHTLNRDLVIIGQLASQLHSEGKTSNTILFMPYIPGARADRNTPNGCKVYAGIINSFGFMEVVVLDAHSPVSLEHLHNVKQIYLDIDAIKDSVAKHCNNRTITGIIAPDKGAVNRATSVANLLNVPVIKAEKVRDFTTGKLTGFTCEDFTLTTDNDFYLIVDDICDGGGTFMGLAETLKTRGVTKQNLGLIVSHGIFSGNNKALSEHFCYIASSNSIHRDESSPLPQEFATIELDMLEN